MVKELDESHYKQLTDHELRKHNNTVNADATQLSSLYQTKNFAIFVSAWTSKKLRKVTSVTEQVPPTGFFYIQLICIGPKLARR